MKRAAKRFLLAALIILSAATIAWSRTHHGNIASIVAVYDSAAYRTFAVCYGLGLGLY